ncbi:GTPase IMAP family member 4-like [Alosa sapidissima]|uniref:GTPase IMAP family member 4-like n=1 Tax=Alosa sapidissima TaxID=34773 RepID=UPI001C09433B|nr:GTPase IMAP family member 4-like [Alosa sapidissima]
MEEPPFMGGESPGPAPPVSPAVSELRLVLLGGSTAGKRAAGNTILGTHTLTHTSTESQHSESRQGEVAGRRVTVVDTPDWFCSELSEKDMRQDVGLCVRLSAPGPHAFLLVIPVEPSEGEERRMLEKMEDIFGEGCWGHTLILFTHAEGLRERSVEELLQTGSQELQQLVEKCGNRCHLLNIKDRPDDTKITQLLEKIEEMVSGNRERFYSSETYQEAERQLREIERRMQKEREVEERKLREERERREEHDKNVQESLKKMEGEIQQHETEIRTLSEKTTELERKMKEERDEEKKREIERELNKEIALREEMERKNISISKEKMEAEFNRQMEEKEREIERMRRVLSDRDSESESERGAIQRLSISLLHVMSPELQH